MVWHRMVWHGCWTDRGWMLCLPLLTSDFQVVDRVRVSRGRKRGPLYRQRLRSSVPNHHLTNEEKVTGLQPDIPMRWSAQLLCDPPFTSAQHREHAPMHLKKAPFPSQEPNENTLCPLRLCTPKSALCHHFACKRAPSSNRQRMAA